MPARVRVPRPSGMQRDRGENVYALCGNDRQRELEIKQEEAHGEEIVCCEFVV